MEILRNTEVKEMMGDGVLDAIKLINDESGGERVLGVDQLFIFIGSILKREWMKDLGLELEGGRLKVDGNMRTRVKGIFATGDITGDLKRIPNDIAQGQKAAYSVCKYIRRPYWA